MGLIRELFDLTIPLPSSRENQINYNSNIHSYYYKPLYATLNTIFQFLDCIIIPIYALIQYESWVHDGNFLKLIIVFLLAFSAIFSISQFVYFFIKSPDDYVSFKDRLLGETTIGALVSAIFKIKIYYYL